VDEAVAITSAIGTFAFVNFLTRQSHLSKLVAILAILQIISFAEKTNQNIINNVLQIICH